MTSKKAFAVWILIVFAFLGALGTTSAWTMWQSGGLNQTVTILLIGGSEFQTGVATYFAAMLAVTTGFLGGVCIIVFRSESYELPIYQLSRDLEEKLNEKSQEIKDSQDETLTKLGLREFQLAENMNSLRGVFEKLGTELLKSTKKHEKALSTIQEKLTKAERQISRIQSAQKELPNLKKLSVIEAVEKNVKSIHGIIEKIDYAPKPYLASTDKINSLGGEVLKRGTIRRLKSRGIEQVEDLLLKSPVELALTNALSESEAKTLQSLMQLLMVPGVQHKDAMLLLKSGINSKQELALQESFSLGTRISKTAELYVEEGKLQADGKPTLEEIASWIKWAKTQ